jgi:hypothetical protein
MASLPDNHPVWQYSNPAEAHCFMMGMIPTHIEKLNEFISWYDKQIEIIYEIKQKYTTHPTIENAGEAPGDWGSSSVEPTTWDRPVKIDHEADLRLWNHVPKGFNEDKPPVNPVPDNKNQENEHDSDGENEEYKEDPFYYDPELTNLHSDSKKLAREDRDDEQEFNRIPIQPPYIHF